MKKIAYYHLYLTDDNSWIYLFIDQMASMIDYGLWDELDEFNVTAIGKSETFIHMKELLGYYKNLSKKDLKISFTDLYKNIDDGQLISLDYFRNSDIYTETDTLKVIHERCEKSIESFNVLYFHGKGVTALDRPLRYGNYPTIINTIHWRKYMDWCCLEKWEECNNLMVYWDTVGTNSCQWPSPHYSGNYWWATSEYISSLKSPVDKEWWENYKAKYPNINRLPDRIVAEMWIGSGENIKMYSMHNPPYPPPQSNLGERFINRRDYIRKSEGGFW